MRDIISILARVIASPALLTPGDDNAKTELIVDPQSRLWVNAGDNSIPAAGTAGAPLVVFDTPAVATAPDADTPAAGGALRNQLNTLVVTVNAVNAQPMLTVTVRDGGIAGAILWAFNIGALAAGTSREVPIPGLVVTGTANTEMTINTAAPAAGNFVSIAWTGKVVE